jgi:hypothetical protein
MHTRTKTYIIPELCACTSVLLRFAVMPEHGLAGCNGFLTSKWRIRYILPIRVLDPGGKWEAKYQNKCSST